MIRVCAWCHPTYCLDHPEEEVTSTICQKHFEEKMQEVKDYYNKREVKES